MSSSGSGSYKQHGLVGDFWPNIRLMQLFGFAMFDFHDNNSVVMVMLRKAYAYGTMALILIHYFCVVTNFRVESKNGGDLAADTITMLFFAHPVVKFCYFAWRTPLFYRALGAWNTVNSHPLFAESHARHRAAGAAHVRKLVIFVVSITTFTIVAWTTTTFFGESTKERKMKEGNETITLTLDVPRLPIHAWYPFDAKEGMAYMFSFLYQLYWLTMTLFHANLYDLLFCCFMVVACEQLNHVKDALKPLLDLSASQGMPTDLFRVDGDDQQQIEEPIISKDEQQINIRGIYSDIRDFGVNGNNGQIATLTGPNGLNAKQELMVRSAIKYWVERHKHIQRYVEMVGEAYGMSLLLHMLISTVTLTLLAYQATQVTGMNVFSASVIGYLLYTLGQVFAFCLYGNNLIEESASVMEAAYNCQWYESSEEAKTFVQIVCQQCQKSTSISGAKFFTISLDLFASVLGAVATYFMVLVQLK